MKILKRIAPGDPVMGTGYSSRAKGFRQFYIHEYAKFMEEEGTGRYYRKKLILNYLYKGPLLEWSLRIKMRMEKNYQRYNELAPRNAEILELGCGYGFLSHMLSLTAPGRRITGVDPDEEKIRVASHTILKNNSIEFFCEDITIYKFGYKDVILLGDVLFKLNLPDQEALLARCIEKLNPGGLILLSSAKPDDAIVRFAMDRGLTTEIMREAKRSSNILVTIRK